MPQVKIFTGIEGGAEELSKSINDWAKETGAKMLQVTGNIAPQSMTGSGSGATLAGSGASGRAPSDILVIVLYETE